MTVFRRVCQWGAIGILLLLPMLSRGAALYQSYGPGASHVKSLTSPWEFFLYKSFGYLFGGFADPAAVADQFQGSYWSITLFGITITDPLALLGHVVATGSLHWPLLAGVLTPVLLAVIAGRIFCGWVCPVNTILELNGKLRRWLERRIVRRRLPDWRPSPRLRYLLLAAGILIAAISGIGVFALMLPYNALARDWHLIVYQTGFGFGVLFLMVLLVAELFVAPRLWCRSLCPTGLVLGLLGRKRLFGIARKPARTCLSGCSLCVTACPAGVIPKDEINTEECLMCNECVAQCPKDVLGIGIAANAPRAAKARLGPLLAVPLTAALLALSPPDDAAAHHIKGLPHYGYVENYPQTPTLERHATAPPYEITLVVYTLEGLERQSSETPHDAMVYVSIAETATGKPFTGKLAVTFRPADGGAATTRRFKAPLEETVYRTRVALPASDYDLVFRIAGTPETVGEMRLSLGQAVNWWLVVASAIGLAAVATLSALVVRRRRRLTRQG